jgi:glycosyltransferase involved in cell wall biosynthesis
VIVVGHSCVCSWWRAVKGEDAPPEWAEYRRRVRDGLAAADLVVAPSRDMLGALRTNYGPLPASRVIYNGRDASLYAASKRKRPMILSAGRLWDEAKNLAALEAIAGELDWPVYVSGDEQGPDGTSNRARRTRPLGRLAPETLARWLGAASIYCLPAKYEPFGLSAVEAALSGCALVLGDIPSLREVWGDAAEYVPPRDTVAVRDTLNAIARDPAWRHDLPVARTIARSVTRRGGWSMRTCRLTGISPPAPDQPN